MSRLSLWIICAALVAIGVILMSSSDQPKPAAQLPDALNDSPDLLMASANILRYRPDGSLSYRLAARQIRHFDAQPITRLDTAHLLLMDQADEPPWDVNAGAGNITRQPEPSAQSGASAQSEEVVFLHDDVEMAQENPDGSFIRLQTPSIYYYPDRQYAETSQNVMIDTDVGRTKAAGLQGELQHGLIRLFSSEQVRVHTIVLRPQFR